MSKAADSKKEEIDVQREVSVTSFYTYSGENDSKTKTSRKENGDLWWSPGDEIMVFCGEASGKFVSQNEESAEIATFVGSFDKDVSTSDVSANGVLAFYPYSDALTREGNSVVFTLPSSQLAVAGTFDDDLYPVIARSDTTELSFYNICGGAKFTVSKKGIKTVTIRGNDSEPLAGKLSVTLDENGIPIVEVVDGEKEIVVTAPDGSTLEVGKEYYIVTIPQCLKKGFTLIYNQGLNIYNEFQTTKSINIKRSKFGVLEDLDENLDIADWDDPIEFKSSSVKKICVTEWDTNGDGKLSYKEAALVQTIGTVFKSIKEFYKFDELKYFTGLTSIGDNAFYGCSGLESVTIPSSVTSIGDYAFYGCRSLQSVTIPSSVTSIGSGAFYYCSGLESVTIPSSVTSIGSRAFYDCSGLQSVTIPSSVTSIGAEAFNGCGGDLYVNRNIPSYSSYDESPFYDGNFTSLVIGEGVTSIGDNAFYGCRRLQSVTIPSSVTSIGSRAFYGCSRLQSVTIPSSVTSIGAEAFRGCGGDLYVNRNIPSYSSYDESPFYDGNFRSLVIGEGVTSIGDKAFYGCSHLQRVTIPSSVTSIGYRAFYGCGGDLYINCNIPSYISSNSPFDGSKFTSFVIGEGVTSIGYGAISYCSRLQSVTIPSSVTSISSSAFNGFGGDLYVNCNIPSYRYHNESPFFKGNFTSLVIGEGVTSIGANAFYHCSSLQSVTIPSSVTSIGFSAFPGCGGDLYVNCNIPSYRYSSDSPFYDGNFTSLVIGEGVTSIGDNAFYGCSGLQSVTIPSSVTSIGSGAFYGCSSLQSVTIPSSVTSIDYGVFYGCSGLQSVTIPTSVTSIGSSAFYGCSGLQSVTIPNSVTKIGKRAFYGCSGDLYVNCNIPSYSSYDASPFYNSNFTSLVIGESVTLIGSSAFYGCSGLQSVTIPSSVTSIGSRAFYGCSGDLYVNCNIPSYSFNNGNFTSLVIGEGVTSIGSGAFEGCSGLQSVTIPNSVTSIGSGAFEGCSGLQSVTIPNSVTKIGSRAFYGCENLKTVFVKAETPPAISTNAFGPIPDCFIIYVPYSSLDNYLDSWRVLSPYLLGYAF
ncbi:MAG: leucine-rich repeat domain-containing protein [Bacteroidales bacterium]|nr:leucine-rich repeat domain-containing protein [Bacteroidales bacterium]MDY6171542.1 leucine-rich repeat domain-containing protein [Candidatus Cryptobacteroides sp.]